MLRVFSHCSLALITIGLFLSTVHAASSSENLFEYAYASYGDGGLEIPMPHPPILKVYKDGLAIFQKGEKYFIGRIESQKLRHLIDKLSTTSLLKRSEFVEIKKGDMVGLHGGVAYLRYLDRDKQIVIATEVLPESGGWAKVVRMVQGYLPRNAAPFYPESIRLRIINTHFNCVKGAENSPDIWPLTNNLRLGSSEQVVEIEDAEIIRYLFQSMYSAGSLWFTWGYCEEGKHFRLELDHVSDWYNDESRLIVGWFARDLQKRWRGAGN